MVAFLITCKETVPMFVCEEICCSNFVLLMVSFMQPSYLLKYLLRFDKIQMLNLAVVKCWIISSEGYLDMVEDSRMHMKL